MKVVGLFGLLILAGRQVTPVDQLSYSEVRALAQQIEKRCEAQGIPKTSPEFSACTKQEANREVAVRQANYDNWQRRRARHTTCTAIGYTVICN